MDRLTNNVHMQYPIGSSMVVCINDHGNDSMSADVRATTVCIEIDDGEDRCVSFDMCMDDAKAFFAAAHNIVVPASMERD